LETIEAVTMACGGKNLVSNAFNNFSQHSYRVQKINPSNGKEITTYPTVIGSRAAAKLQEELEEQGFAVSVFNLTKGTEEWNSLWVENEGEENDARNR
jgi:hypothetical protein